MLVSPLTLFLTLCILSSTFRSLHSQTNNDKCIKGNDKDFELTFQFDWSAQNDPDFPNGDPVRPPGFSPIICFTHSPDYFLWRAGSIASADFREYLLDISRNKPPREFFDLIKGLADSISPEELVINPNLEASSTYTTTLTVRPPFVNVTCVSKIIPSPDWFIGVSQGVCNIAAREYTKEFTGTTIEPWDAGFDDSRDYEFTKRLPANISRKVRPLLGIKANGYGLFNISAVSSETPTPEPDAKCFPADQRVYAWADPSRKARHLLPMNRLKIGTSMWNLANESDRIVAFTHATPHVVTTFVRISFKTPTNQLRSIRLSPGHFIYTTIGVIPAREVDTSMYLLWFDDTPVRVINVRNVRGNGLYNPHTESGVLIVQGVKVSCYTMAVEPKAAHALLAPIRALSALQSKFSQL